MPSLGIGLFSVTYEHLKMGRQNEQTIWQQRRGVAANHGFSRVMLLEGRTSMFRFLLGPFLALLPKRWRQSLLLLSPADWRVPTMLSGLGEFLLAVAALLYWYSYSVTTWVSRGLDVALAGKAGPGLNEQEIGFMAIFIFATHPLTWLIAYFAAEGSVRLVGAAFAESHLGILPLFVLDKVLRKATGQSGPSAAEQGGYREGNLSSFVGAIREKVRVSRSAGVPDELCQLKEGAEEFLEIRASRRKPDWTPPRTVKYQDTFYRTAALSLSFASPVRRRPQPNRSGVFARRGAHRLAQMNLIKGASTIERQIRVSRERNTSS